MVHAVKARLPYQRDVAGIGGLESPRQKSRHGIAADWNRLAEVHICGGSSESEAGDGEGEGGAARDVHATVPSQTPQTMQKKKVGAEAIIL